MPSTTLYKIEIRSKKLLDAVLEIDSSKEFEPAVILHARSGNPVKNTEFSDALRHILGRLLPMGRITAVLLDSNKTKGVPREERILCRQNELSELSVEEAARLIRTRALRSGQSPRARGGNATKRLRIETDYALQPLTTCLRLRKVRAVNAYRVSEEDAAVALCNLKPTEDELKCVENDIRMAQHFRIERSRSRKLVEAKRQSVRDANNGRLACEYGGCPVDWYSVYPAAVAEGVFEVHHRVPLSQLDGPVNNGEEALQMLCASCHRAEHRRLSGA